VRKKVLVSVKQWNKVAVILLPKPTFMIWGVTISTNVAEGLVVVLDVVLDVTQRVLL
jgi:uncharacterized phage infection (PIP) family protein YhgE